MTNDDVPDSTDWLSTPLSSLAAVENALRCQVCKDFYKTPMLTTCSHTFCSLCIRRALANDGKCPLCRSPEQELKLRSNWSLEETIEAFVKARPATLQLARSGGNSRSAGKRKAESESPGESDAPEGKRLRTSARLRKNKTDQPVVDAAPQEDEDEVFETPDSDDAYVPEPEDGLVPCPVCQTRMKDWQVFRHLESCPGPTPTRKKKVAESNSFDRMQRQQTKLERLPALNYSVLREQALRKKLAELGISNQGPRNLLEKRHKEWITLWNANCDAARPKKRSELLHDLEIWEKTQGGRVLTMGRAAQNPPMVKDKDFDGEAWSAKHDSSFKDLIASARRSRMEAKKKAEEAAKSSNTESSKQPSTTPAAASSSRPSMETSKQTSAQASINQNDAGFDFNDWGEEEGMSRFDAWVEEKRRRDISKEEQKEREENDAQHKPRTDQFGPGSNAHETKAVSGIPSQVRSEGHLHSISNSDLHQPPARNTVESGLHSNMSSTHAQSGGSIQRLENDPRLYVHGNLPGRYGVATQQLDELPQPDLD